MRQIQATIELLDEGNTVPFITRYRKDQTGGLDEEQIREIQSRLNKSRLLADRKQTILRSIESQGKLTEDLTKRILAATTTKRLEDLYLPFKPKKMSLATLARSRGLELLAREIYEAAATCADLDARAADFVNTDRQVPTAADALLGAGHIIAEHISEQAELRQRLREVLQRSGVLVSSRIAPEIKPEDEPKANERDKPAEAKTAADEAVAQSPKAPVDEPSDGQPADGEAAAAATSDPAGLPAEQSQAESPIEQSEPTAEAAAEAAAEVSLDEQPPAPQQTASAQPTGEQPEAEAPPAAQPAEQTTPAESAGQAEPTAEATPAPSKPTASERKLARKLAKEEAKKKRLLQKKKQDEKRIKAFSDYFDYRESTRRIPPHRVLAINRGEKAKVLRVRIESDLQTMVNIVDEWVVTEGHPNADYLRGCARDALNRLILPSLEREIRRELTDRAETHAVSVFAKNLRNLFLQPPVHDQRVLAVDPGFRSGCKLAVLDQFGNLLDQGVIHLVGKPDRTDEAKKTVLDLIAKHQLTLVVIGNGTACRQTEDFIARLIEDELKDRGMAYVIVNEAGASVYSTSRLGREEFPNFDAVLRGAISIGRRLQDPLSELVKIDPASIGVGLYQHDVKAKHLRASLDEVVESCVNYVGVNVNTASPALLRYVSGMNQLTARRLCEYRREKGPFRSRQQLREVPGFGEATFVQAAGFLKIPRGDNPLDASWIHPESYETANRAVKRLLGDDADLGNKETFAALAEPIAKVDLSALAKELEVGELTLKDILTQLVRPGHDPREDLPPPLFKRGVLKIEDLSQGMELNGTVLNVVDFGCFVDIGMHNCGLVHVSRLADKYIRDPHEVVSVGDIVKVWVMGVDKERQRVSLTMVKPGSERSKHPPRRGEKPAAEDGAAPGRERSRHRPPRQTSGDRPPQQQTASSDRPPRPHGRGRPGQEQHRPRPYRPRPAPKPLTPITKEMKEGKEPMRTFGDLLQFYQQKPADGGENDHPPARDDSPPKTAPGQSPEIEQLAQTVDKAVSESVKSPSVASEETPVENESPPSVEQQLPVVDKVESPAETNGMAAKSDEQPTQP